MIDFLYTLVVFLVALGVLVIVHEWGHYIMARLAGIWVQKFSIGFGPKIMGIQKNGTDFRIAPIPLGGYVSLYGADPETEADGDLELAQKIAKDPRSFVSKSYLKRMGVVLGGPFINFILCLLLLPLAFWIGKKELKFENEKPVVIGIAQNSIAETINLQIGDEILTFNGEATPTWEDLIFKTATRAGQNATITFQRGTEIIEKQITLDILHEHSTDFGVLGIEPHPFLLDQPLIGEVNPGTPAEAAGLKPGDRIRRLDGVEVQFWTQMLDALKQENVDITERTLNLQIERDGQLLNLVAKPEYDKTEKRWMLGILKHVPENLYGIERHSLGESLRLTWPEFKKLSGRLFEFLDGLFSGEISAKHLGGPIQIASEASKAAQRGIGDFIYLLAFLSLQLGILNLVPIPVLDGGQAVLMSVEAVIRRPIPRKIKQGILYFGVGLVLLITAFALFNDLNRSLGLGQLWESFLNLF